MLGLLAALPLMGSRPPNIVVIFCDDLGIGDVGAYGNKRYRTPNIDRLAAEGIRFTDFAVAAPACSPSRAALLTGCYPVRVGIPEVLGPDSRTGLSLDETTVAELVKPLGYATAIVGKWHLGVQNLNPLAQGFDTFFGLPYSHDMWPPNGKGWPRLFLQRDGKQLDEIKTLDDQAKLTRLYTEASIRFMEANQRRPFLLYLPHSMPHVPIAASKRFAGKTKQGLYADTIAEIDWSVGEIMRTLKRLNLERDTLVMFSSDNGPWRPYGDHAGSPGIFREGKGTTFEAGVRVPGIFRWTGRIPPRQVSRELVTAMDLLPTVARITGAKLPDRKIDGHDVSPILFGEATAKSPTKQLFYFWPGELQAIRVGDWKLHVPHRHRHQTEPSGRDGKSAGETTQQIGLSLYDLSTDPGETRNVADQHPDVVQRLLRAIEAARHDLGDTLTKTVGTGVRAPGRVVNDL